MQYGLRKGLEDIAHELNAIRNILSTMWVSAYGEAEKQINPQAFADEYISTEECGRRLGVSEQTIRNWISIGMNNPDKGWKENIHYVNVSPFPNKKAVLRIPWNRLIQSFGKNESPGTMEQINGHSRPMYQNTRIDRLP